jgi:hypothetical protein
MLLYDWRFTANQFVLASSPLRTTTRHFFQLSCRNSPYVTFSVTRRWVCWLLWIYTWHFVKSTFHTYSMLLKISSFCTTHNPLSVQALHSRACVSYVSYAVTAAYSLERSQAWSPESELYYDRRSVSQSVLEQSTHLGLTTRFLLLSDHCGFLIRGALSDERTGLSFKMYDIQYILLSQIWDQVPVFISPRNRVARLYPQALGLLLN